MASSIERIFACSMVWLAVACDGGAARTATPPAPVNPAAPAATSSGDLSTPVATGSAGQHAPVPQTAGHMNELAPVEAGSRAAQTPAPDEDAGVRSPSVETGSLPAVRDLMARGPFTPKSTESIGPDGTFTGIGPAELGQGGLKHPVFVWSNGGGIGPDVYKTLLEFVASHGIFVMSYNSTALSTELKGAIDWVVTESTRPESPFYQKLDASKIAAGGQSYGSLGAFWIADDARITTTVHINGGTLDDHADVKKLVKVALFLCGDDPDAVGGDGFSKGDVARPNCDADFQLATTPVWYGVVNGSSHTTIIDDPLGTGSADDPLKKPYLAATVAWLRWQLAGDQSLAPFFVGSDCRFCADSATWKVQQKDLH